MTDAELARHVAAELAWDPRIDGARITVAVLGSRVTLRGTVGSFRQKREAGKAAGRVRGVVGVDDRLGVVILAGDRRADADLRDDVLQALLLDAHVPPSVGVSVRDGVVTLTGDADWQHQRDEAGFIAGNILGVTRVDNRIRLTGRAKGNSDIAYAITRAFIRHATLDAGALAVAQAGGAVILTGTVRSWFEHDAAVAAAWAAPGVTTVDDHLTVTC